MCWKTKLTIKLPHQTIAIHGRGDRDEDGTKTGFNLGIPVNSGLADLNRAIQLDPNNANAYQNRSIIKYTRLDDSPEERLRQRSGAIADLQQAAKLSEGQGNPKKYQLAIDKLKKWQETNPKSSL
jgi:hypothetical protein